jgi:hypothetical protein
MDRGRSVLTLEADLAREQYKNTLEEVFIAALGA